jgi:uncharacterized SAM-binding protein YcdF (DUF218 family)
VNRAFLELTHPLTFAILLLAAGVVLWRRGVWARILCAAALLVIVIFGAPMTANALLRPLEEQYPDTPVDALPQAQAIVVLGGSVHVPSLRHREIGLVDGSDRERHAVRLYKAGKAPLVLASGGSHPAAGGGRLTPEAQVMSALMQEWGVPAQAILVEDRSLDTHQNAVFSFQFLSARGIRNILLVTSAAHMPRAAAAFRKAGFVVVPAPADFLTGWAAFDVPLSWWPNARSMTRSDLAIREWLGLLAYRLCGWA